VLYLPNTHLIFIPPAFLTFPTSPFSFLTFLPHPFRSSPFLPHPFRSLPFLPYPFPNQIAPAYAGVEIGVGDTIVMKALVEATGGKLAHMKVGSINALDMYVCQSLHCPLLTKLILVSFFPFPSLTCPYLTLLSLTFPFLTLPYFSLPYLTLLYLSLPYLIFPYLPLPHLTFPYLTLPYFTRRVFRRRVTSASLRWRAATRR
jgi:hypothetical protein